MASQSLFTQPKFDPRIFQMAFPLTGESAGTIQRGYMVWDQPLPGYAGKAHIAYLYNPSTVSSDFNIADASAQASLNFPNPGDSAMLAIPLSQTVQWSLMFDRTFELWGSYVPDGTPQNPFATGSADPTQIGVQADVLAFMQFTGMLTNYSYGTNGAGGTITAPTTSAINFNANSGIMQLVPAWAYFGSSTVNNNLQYYGYINEWSVQYTHWTQYNIPMRCVISVNFTMLPSPATSPSQDPTYSAWTVLPTVTGNAPVPSQLTNPLLTPTNGVGGR